MSGQENIDVTSVNLFLQPDLSYKTCFLRNFSDNLFGKMSIKFFNKYGKAKFNVV